jgi:hypothetical protein
MVVAINIRNPLSRPLLWLGMESGKRYADEEVDKENN